MVPACTNCETNDTPFQCIVPMNKYRYSISFGKVDAISKLPLSTAQFEVMSYDRSYKFKSSVDVEDGVYLIEDDISVVNNFGLTEYDVSYEELLQLIPDAYRDIINSINNIDDYNNYSENNSLFSYDNNCNIGMYSFHLPIRVEEVKSPLGYQKSSFIIPSVVTVSFRFDESNNNLLSKTIVIKENYRAYFKDDANIGNITYSANTDNFHSYMLENGVFLSGYCDGNYTNNYYSCYPYYEFPVLEDEVGQVVLSVENTIQDEHNVSLSGDNRVQYKVLVSNTGNASSGNNVVQTSIPKGLDVIENTISDDGVYTTNNRTITWNIDYLDPYGEEELTYDVIVSYKSIGTYKTISNISSDQQLDIVESEPAVLKVINNPKTGQIVFVTELFIIFLVIAVIYSLYKKISKDLD